MPRSRATRAGAATGRRRRRSTSSVGCSPPSEPDLHVVRRSIRATCAPGCTRTPSPARTSPTAPSRRRSSRRCVDSSPMRPPSGRYARRRLAGTPMNVLDRRPTGSRSTCRPSWRRAQPPEARGPDPRRCADDGGAAHRLGRRHHAQHLRPAAPVPRPRRPRRDQHVRHDAGGVRRHRTPTATRARRAPVDASSTTVAGSSSRAGRRGAPPNVGRVRCPAGPWSLGGDDRLRARRAVPASAAGCGSRRCTCRSRCSPGWRCTAVRSATRTSPDPWPIASYQNVYADEPGSAEMPSAGRPFTHEVLTRLVAKGVGGDPDRAPHRRRLARGRRAAVPGARAGAAGDRRPGQPDPRRGSPRDRHRHHRGAGAGERDRLPTA